MKSLGSWKTRLDCCSLNNYPERVGISRHAVATVDVSKYNFKKKVEKEKSVATEIRIEYHWLTFFIRNPTQRKALDHNQH